MSIECNEKKTKVMVRSKTKPVRVDINKDSEQIRRVR